jgi:pimeloyl-ACP methyl ester carboxylesterase
MQARVPDHEDWVECDGVRIGYQVYGGDGPTILLLPTWTVIHSRFWKAQIPYLARHFRVVTYDGPGNGRSDRPVDSLEYWRHRHEDFLWFFFGQVYPEPHSTKPIEDAIGWGLDTSCCSCPAKASYAGSTR